MSVSSQCALFHSTPASCEKWKSKFNFDFTRGQQQQPSKNHIRYATRQKRADSKKALKDLLHNYGTSRFSLQDEEPICKIGRASNWDSEQEDLSDSSDKKARSKGPSRRAGKVHYKRLRRKLRKASFTEDFEDHHETVFQATFGNRSFSWSFKSWQDSNFSCNPEGFEWRKDSSWTSSKKKEWDTTSETESDHETYVVGSTSDRTILGLPPRGPLKIEDVKSAFRSSALKWHPDKHQGPSQALAEERFKVCVNAYKSLCTALSAV